MKKVACVSVIAPETHCIGTAGLCPLMRLRGLSVVWLNYEMCYVPGAESKAGMACIVGDEESVDVGGLAEKVYRALPAYAVPLFVHLTHQPDLTGTFKFQKTDLYNSQFILNTTKKMRTSTLSCRMDRFACKQVCLFRLYSSP